MGIGQNLIIMENPNHAFEVMCNILFKCWLKKEYKDNISHLRL